MEEAGWSAKLRSGPFKSSDSEADDHGTDDVFTGYLPLSRPPPANLERNGMIPRLRPIFAVLAAAFLPAAPAAAQAVAQGRLVPDLEAVARSALLVLPPPPAWSPAAAAGTWTIDDIKAELARHTDRPPRVNFVRTTMLRPDHAWLLDFKGWFRAIQKPLKMHFEHQLFDCDNYANAFVAFADLLALKAGEARGSACIGWASVYYRRPFAGVRAGAHAVVVVATSRGLHILEPQDGTMVPLAEFPNRHTIEEINF